MDYRIYAYLQTAQDAKARELVGQLPSVEARFDPEAIGGAAPGSAGVFALAAIPARYALERGAWGVFTRDPSGATEAAMGAADAERDVCARTVTRNAYRLGKQSGKSA